MKTSLTLCNLTESRSDCSEDGGRNRLTRSCPSSSLRVSPEAFFMAEPDRDRLWHRQSSRDPTRELQISGGFEDSCARFHRLLQQDFRPAIPMELHRSPCPKRSDQTAKHLEGKLGKTNTAITDFRFGIPTTITCGTSERVTGRCRQRCDSGDFKTAIWAAEFFTHDERDGCSRK